MHGFIAEGQRGNPEIQSSGQNPVFHIKMDGPEAYSWPLSTIQYTKILLYNVLSWNGITEAKENYILYPFREIYKLFAPFFCDVDLPATPEV